MSAFRRCICQYSWISIELSVWLTYLGGKISIYESMIDLTKDSVLVRQLLHVADMIPLVLLKIAYHKTHSDCAEVISKILWPMLRVHNISQQKSGYILYILYFEINLTIRMMIFHNWFIWIFLVVIVEHFCCGI